MKVYPKYKPSGIDWLGEIPETWEVWKAKFLCTKVATGNTPSSNELKYYENGEIDWFTPGDFGNDFTIINSQRKVTKIAVEEKKCELFNPFSTFVIGIGATLGKVRMSKAIASANQQINVLEFSDKILPKFGFFYFYSIENTIVANANLSTMGIINQTKMKNLQVSLPSKNEQQQIVNFLDYKTGQCDRFIANRQKQIELLNEQKAAIINKAVTKGINPNAKMKPSGIEWIGDIPDSWKISKVKFVASIFGRIGFRGYTTNDIVDQGKGAITISPSNMKENQMDFSSCTYISWFKYEESPEIKIFNGDVLFVKTGSTYGKTSFVENLHEPATINPQVLVFKKIKINSLFFYHQVRAKLIQSQVKTSVIGGSIPTISQEKIGNYYFLLPSKKEQDQIIEHIQKETSKIETLIAKYQKQIDLMQEYRTALISQAVTGKIDVRDWQLPHN